MYRRSVEFSGIFFLIASFLTGCSSGSNRSGGGGGGGSETISVTVAASPTTVDGTDSVKLIATVANDTGSEGVTWSVSGGGALSGQTTSAATYTAPTATSTALTVTVTATSVADSTKSGTATISIPSAPVIATLSFDGTVGTPFSAQLEGSGGIPPYTWTMASGSTLPACLTLTASGVISPTSSTAPTYSCLGSYYPIVTMTDSGTPNAMTTPLTTLNVDINAAPFISFAGSMPANAAENEVYSGSAAAIGGAGTLTYSVAKGALPGGLSLNSTSAAITGAPTAVGTFNFTIMAADAYGDSGSQSYQIVVNNPAQTGDGNLKGTYTCLAQGYDFYNNPTAMLASMVADGQGNITGGEFDITGADYSTDETGTITGSYTVGTDNNGTEQATYISGGAGQGQYARSWAIALTNAATPAAQFLMVENDDVGSSAAGYRATANCYLADTGAFSSSTLNNNFVFAMEGQSDPGTSQATVMATLGRFDASGGSISNGYMDTAIGEGTSASSNTFTGSFGTLDSTSGRVPLTLTSTGGSTTLIFYIIDRARALALNTTANSGPTGDSTETEGGDVRMQQQKSYSGANASNPFVLYLQGTDTTTANGYSKPSGYYSEALEGTGDGKGNLIVQQSYEDKNGIYNTSFADGSMGLDFDANNPGRATYVLGNSFGYLYFFDNSSALEMSVSTGSVDAGWLEPQSQATFTGSAVAGDYMVGQLPLMQAGQNGSVGNFHLSSSGGITGGISTAGQGVYTFDQAVNMTYTWDLSAPGTGSFLLSGSFGKGSASCVVISETRFVCTPQSDAIPYVMVGQQ